MSKEKQHLDEFLRDKLNELPNAPVAGFEKVEDRMAAKSHRGIVLMLLIPLIFSGIYWVTTLTEKDLMFPTEHQDGPLTRIPNSAESAKAPVEVIAVEEVENDAPIRAMSVEKKEPVTATLQASSASSSIPLARSEETASPVHAQHSDLLLANGMRNRPPPQLSLAESHINVVRTEPITQPSWALAVAGEPKAKVQAAPAVFVTEASSPSVSTLTQASLAEELAPVYTPQTPWEITMNFYPNYTFREFKVNPNYEHMVDPRYEQIISQSERGGFGFNLGVTARYHLGGDVFIASGLGYIENKINGAYNFEIYQPIDPNLSNNVARIGKTEELDMYTSIPVNQGIIQTFRFVQVPLHLSYQPWATERIRLLIEGGFSYIHFISASGTTIDYQTLVPRDVADLNYVDNMASVDFKVGFAYYLSQQVAVGLEPSFLYFTQSIFEEDHPTYVVPWSVGVNFNVRMRLY